MNAHEAIPIRNTLEELGHNQPPTPIQVDNTTAVGFIHKQIKQRRSKAINMRFYQLQDHQQQQQFNIYWCEGSKNLADYFSKHFAPTYHNNKRAVYLHEPKMVNRILSTHENVKPLRHIINVCNMCAQLRTAGSVQSHLGFFCILSMYIFFCYLTFSILFIQNYIL